MTEALAAEHMPTAGESRHHATLALAHDALARGIDRDELDAALIAERFGPAGDHPFEADEAERILDNAYDGKRADVVDLVNRVLDEARGRNWRGARLRVLRALLDIAIDACTISPGASYRLIAERAGCDVATAHRAARDLAAWGWVERNTRTSAVQGWSLTDVSKAAPQLPESRPGFATIGEIKNRNSLRPVVALPGSGALRAQRRFPVDHDAFRHGALGSTGHGVVVALSERADDGLAIEDLASAVSLSPKTLRNAHVPRLLALGLAERRAGGRLALTAETLADPLARLDVVAALLGTRGAGERQRRRHEEERRARRASSSNSERPERT